MKQKARMLFLGLLGTFFLQEGLGFDELTDASFEKRIHNMYKTKAFQPVTDEEWSAFMGRVQSETYNVRKGDTLWGMSQAFFGDGLYWPKIWSLNSRITNPHLIMPGAEVRFFSGTMSQAPGVEVLTGPVEDPSLQPVVVDSPGGDLPSGGLRPKEDSVNGTSFQPPSSPAGNPNLYPGAPAMPPHTSKVTPVTGIPPLFATSSFSVQRYDRSGVSFDVRPPTPISSKLIAHSFFSEGREKDYPTEGKVLEVEDGEESVGFGGLVYVVTQADAAVGDRFTVVSPDFSHRVNGTRGTVFRYSGSIQLTEALGDRKFRARVATALFPIGIGAYLSKENTPIFSDTLSSPKSGRFEVAGGAYLKERDVFGRSSVIFLAAGSAEGVAVGDSFGIYKNRKLRYDNVDFKESPRPIAIVKVFRVGERTSSGMILTSMEDVRIGDYTGSAQYSPSQVSFESSESTEFDDGSDQNEDSEDQSDLETDDDEEFGEDDFSEDESGEDDEILTDDDEDFDAEDALDDNFEE